MIYTIKECIADSLSILRASNLSIFKKVILFVHYVKIRIQSVLHNRLYNFRTVTFLSYRISFVTFEELLLLVREIFIEQSYKFSSEKDDPLIIDCGGNIGMSVLYFKYLFPRSRIVVFEPNPEAFLVLQKNIMQNKLTSVDAHNVALGNTDGKMDFFVRAGMSLASSFVDISSKESHKITVDVAPLSTFITERVDLLKIDVQFYETYLMQDLVASGKLERISKIVLEFHYLANQKNNVLSDMLRIFEQNNFLYFVYLNKIKDDNFATYTIRAKRNT